MLALWLRKDGEMGERMEINSAGDSIKHCLTLWQHKNTEQRRIDENRSLLLLLRRVEAHLSSHCMSICRLIELAMWL
jgi:hypothetical protein